MISRRYLALRYHGASRVFSVSHQRPNMSDKSRSQFDSFLAQLQSSLEAAPLTLERHAVSSHLELSFSSNFLKDKEDQFSIDFLAKSYTSRISRAKQELLVKAIGGLNIRDISHKHSNGNENGHQDYVVWDLTAGLGRDAFVMAAAGCRVHMFEKNPVLYALLYDGLQRLRRSDNSRIRIIADRLQLYHLDSMTALNPICDFLSRESPSAIYLDPMYSSPESVRRKSKPKKETQILQRLTHLEHRQNLLKNCVETDQSSDLLLRAALQKASCREQHHRCRVVVKRAKSARSLLQLCPDTCPETVFRGSTQRFDVYFPPPLY